MARKSQYMFKRYNKKLVIFAFYGHFHELLPTDLVFQGDLHWPMTRYMFESYDQKLIVFTFYGRFHELLPVVLGFQGDL